MTEKELSEYKKILEYFDNMTEDEEKMEGYEFDKFLAFDYFVNKDKSINMEEFIKFFNRKIDIFDAKYKMDEKALKLLFEKYPNNSNEAEVFSKVVMLNSRYSAGLTNNPLSKEKKNAYEVRDQETGELLPLKDSDGKPLSVKKKPVNVIKMTKHICDLEKEEKLFSKDIVTIVNSIKKIKVEETEGERDKYAEAYSFATKYVSWTFIGKDVPIVDSYVKEILKYINERYSFYNDNCGFKLLNNKGKLKTNAFDKYENFIEIYKQFRDAFHLNKRSYKDTDKFLWVYGKELNKKREKEKPAKTK